MKGKKPTINQRKIIDRHKLNSSNWLVRKNPPGELYLVHRYSSSKRIIKY